MKSCGCLAWRVAKEEDQKHRLLFQRYVKKDGRDYVKKERKGAIETGEISWKEEATVVGSEERRDNVCFTRAAWILSPPVLRQDCNQVTKDPGNQREASFDHSGTTCFIFGARILLLRPLHHPLLPKFFSYILLSPFNRSISPPYSTIDVFNLLTFFWRNIYEGSTQRLVFTPPYFFRWRTFLQYSMKLKKKTDFTRIKIN